MNRSYSKIRHIMEANILLEKRMLNEQVSPLNQPLNSGKFNVSTNLPKIQSSATPEQKKLIDAANSWISSNQASIPKTVAEITKFLNDQVTDKKLTPESLPYIKAALQSNSNGTLVFPNEELGGKPSSSAETPAVVDSGSQNTWLTYPGDKNYQYQKQNGKWMGKNIKTGKVYDLSRYKTSVANLEKTFPGGKAPAGSNTVAGNGAAGNTVGGNTVAGNGASGTGAAGTGGLSSGVNNALGGSTVVGGDADQFITTIKSGTYGVGRYGDEAYGRKIYIRNFTKLKDCNLYEIMYNQVNDNKITSKNFYLYTEGLGKEVYTQKINDGLRCGPAQQNDYKSTPETNKCIPCEAWKNDSLKTNGGTYTIFSKLV